MKFRENQLLPGLLSKSQGGHAWAREALSHALMLDTGVPLIALQQTCHWSQRS